MTPIAAFLAALLIVLVVRFLLIVSVGRFWPIGNFIVRALVTAGIAGLVAVYAFGVPWPSVVWAAIVYEALNLFATRGAL